MRKILVLRGGALGDFIVTLPALSLLRKRWPSAQIELVGNATAAALAIDVGLLDAAHSQHETRWSALFAHEPPPHSLTAWLGDFDLVVNFWPDPDGELGRRFPIHPRQIFLSAAAMPTLAPAAAHYCEPLRTLGLEPPDLFVTLRVSAGNVPPLSRRVTPDRERIAVHPGSGSPRKNWPLARWAQLCEWLVREHRAELLIVTGEADSIASTSLARFGAPAHNLPLAELAARLATCRLFLGHDSGVSHLAAACGVPSVLLFGPTDPAMWAPPASHVRVIRRGPEMDSISVEDVQSLL